MRIYDISRALSETVAVWPGDQPFAPRWSARMEDGSSVNVGAFEMSTHAGTHVDAPLHFRPHGSPVHRFALETFVGPAYVIETRDPRSVGISDVEEVDFTGVPRVLFKTPSSQIADDVFQEDFASIDPAVIPVLRQRGVRLIGTDAPSVDPFDSTDLPTHHELARAGIANLENLCLQSVEAGLYQLIALPLKIIGLDAAPVRAVLLPFLEASSPGPSH